MYKHKYLKYKTKYLNLKYKEFDVFSPENSDIEREDEYFDQDETIQFSDSDSDIATNDDNISDNITPNAPTHALFKELDIGINGLARGKPHLLDDFDKNQYIYELYPDPDKILYINSLDLFDKFTDKYGVIHEDKITIKWDSVMDHFRGIYIDNGLINDRFDNAYFGDKTYISWWNYDFIDINSDDPFVILFKKIEI
jgi:hypothetical protein